MGAGPEKRLVPEDTTLEAYEAQIDAYRRLGGPGRTEAVFRLNDLARELAMAGIRRRHPHYGDEQVRMALVRLKYGEQLARAVFAGREPVEP